MAAATPWAARGHSPLPSSMEMAMEKLRGAALVYSCVLLEPRRPLCAPDRRSSRRLDHCLLALRLHGAGGGWLALWNQRTEGACRLSRNRLGGDSIRAIAGGLVRHVHSGD